MIFTKEFIENIADPKACAQPTGITILDALFDAYNEGDPASRVVDEPYYYRFLYRLAQHAPGLTLVELGTKYGAASLHFLKGGGGLAVAVDCGDRVKHELFKGLPFKFVNARSTSPEALAAVDARPDIILVDTDHSYNTTVGEIHFWLPKLKPGGLMLFDDVQAEEYHKRADFGCGTAFKELAAKYPDSTFYLNHLHLGGWGFGAHIKPLESK